MADNKKTETKLKLPFTVQLKLQIFTLAKFLYIRRDGTINRRIQNLFDLKNSAPATKRINSVSISTSDFTIDPSRSLWFRLFTPISNNTTKLPLIVYFHGGGFNTFTPDSQCYDDLCSQLSARIPAVIVSVNYRLAPEHRYPCQYTDCFDALKFIGDRKNSAILPPIADLENCFIAGDSAGGNIAHHVTQKFCRNSDEFQNLKILGVLSIQPFFGGEERTESEVRLKNLPALDVKQTDWMWRMFLPEGENRDHRAVNVWKDFRDEKEMKGLDFPDVLVIVGGYDPLQDWQKRYAEWLVTCGKHVEVVEYPNAFHGFYAFPQLNEFGAFVGSVTEFIHKRYATVLDGNMKLNVDILKLGMEH